MRSAIILSSLFLLLIPTSVSAGPYEEGLKLVDNPSVLATRIPEAIGKFQAAVKQKPSNVHAWYNLGLLLQMNGDLPGAEAAWKSALKADAGYISADARLAELQLNRGDVEGAKARLEGIIAKHRYQAEARNILAGLAIDAEDWDGAIKHARNVLLGDPENVNAYVNLCVTYFKQGLIDQAWLVATTALDRRREMELPEPAALYNLLGLIYLEKDDSRNAAASFMRALKEDPRQIDAKLNLAALELSYGDFDTALKRFDEALEFQPKVAELHTSRAVALRGLERYEEAEKGYEMALSLDPTSLDPYYNLCVLHHQYTNNYEAAETYCSQYKERIDRKHKKWREITKRVRSITDTLEALRADAAATAAEMTEEGGDPSGETGTDEGPPDPVSPTEEGKTP
ncbi:MAG: tetratricopeptide repeat protein [Myxococcota bacterium]